MGTNSSIDAYPRARNVLDLALTSEEGITMTFESQGKAVNFRQSCYAVRNRDRKDSRKHHEEGDPRYGTSQYDELSLEITKAKNGKYHLIIMNSGALFSNLQIIDNKTGKPIGVDE